MADAELPESLDVIAVGAHPDDVEIACGGTLARLVQLGYRVGIIDLTNGEPTPVSAGPHVRLAEAKAAAGILGVAVREMLPLRNRALFDSFPNRIALAHLFRRYRPRLVLGIAARTRTASPDHWQAMQLTDAAVFYSRLTKWDDEFGGTAPHTISRQLWFPLGFSGLDLPTGGGEFVMDISESFALKLEAVRAYQSQFPSSKRQIFQKVETLNRFWGISAGVEFGELFISSQRIGVRDVMDAMVPPL